MNNIKFSKKNKPLNEKNVNNIIYDILSLLDDESYLNNFVINKNASFTRKRKLPLTVMSKLLFARAFFSLSLFLKIQLDYSCSKQAYSKARKNISEDLFIDVKNKFIKKRYEYKTKLYKNKYLLFAIDGTTLEIPDTELLRNEFGHSKGQENARQRARASASCVYDVLNDMVISSTIQDYSTSERKMAIEMLENVNKNFNNNVIYIMDRGYFSNEMLRYFLSTNNFFVFRLAKSYLKKYVENAKTNDEYIEINIDKKIYKLRIVKIKLITGETEILLTNLSKEEVKYEEMKELYNKRWRIEESYKYMKNKVKIENFSGKTKQSIKQDFYAAIVNHNITQIIAQITKTKETEKHVYKRNMNILYGLYTELVLKKILYVKINIKKIIKQIIEYLNMTLIIESKNGASNKRQIDTKIRKNNYFTNIRPI